MKTRIINQGKFIILLILFILFNSCTSKLEDNSEQLAETTTQMQKSNERQIDDLLIYIDSLQNTISSMEANFFILLEIMKSMSISLKELSKISPVIQKTLNEAGALLEAMSKDSDTPNQESEDIEELLNKRSL